jgi:hypothetical protein
MYADVVTVIYVVTHAKLCFAYLSGHHGLSVVACSCRNAVVPSSDEAS